MLFGSGHLFLLRLAVKPEMDALVEQLKSEISSGKVLAVVGAGVSVGATANNAVASWAGLLTHGAKYCTKLGLTLPAGWEERIIAQIDSGDITEMFSAAQNIAERLSAPNGGDFRSWLRESVGSLSVVDASTIEAIADLNLPIATTNYDSLLTDITRRPPVTWTNPSAAQRWARDDQTAVLHLHGHWEAPESVVLGIRTYDQILGDEATQLLLRSLLYSRTLLFIGYGGGLTDPNFAVLLKWSQRVLAQSEYMHFRLVLDANVDSVRLQHQGDRIRVIGIGESYDKLPELLRSLGSTPKVSKHEPESRESQIRHLTERRSDLFRRKALLDERKSNLSPDEFIVELTIIAQALAKLGGTRSAVTMLHNPLSQSYESLSFATRTEKGLVLVELLLQADDFEFARQLLHKLFEDCTGTDAQTEITEQFWALSAECFASLFAYQEANEAFDKAIERCQDDARRLDYMARRDELQLLRGIIEPLSRGPA